MVTHGRSLRIPSGAAGLVAALAAREHGDDGPLETWWMEGYPLLRAALLDWLPDGDEAADLAGAVMTRAFLAVKAETEVRDELPWLARLARNLRVDAWREERWDSRFTSLSRGGPDEAPGASTHAVPLKSPGEALLLLPSPYREAMAGVWIERWTREEALRLLEQWWKVGREGARRILRVGRRMLAETMCGADPRRRWPRRYAQESVVETYPSPGVLRHGGGGGPRPGLRGGEAPHGREAQRTQAGEPRQARGRPAPPQEDPAEALPRDPVPAPGRVGESRVVPRGR